MTKKIQKIKKVLRENFPFIYSYYIKYQSNKIIENFFHTQLPKKVLICYITMPFKKGLSFSHTNTAESLKIAEAFKDLGYTCDIVNSTNNKKIPYEKYDIIFGFGKAFENSFSSNKKLLRIYYGTGKHPYFSNAATIKRGLEVKKAKGEFLLESLRLVNDDYLLQTTASDSLLLIGGVTDSKTYSAHSNLPIKNIPVSFFKIHDYKKNIENKNFTEAKQHYLFFSGGGLVHKGLDLLLEVFSAQKSIHLHICAPIEVENRFKKLFKEELFKNSNVHTYGFISLESIEFKKLIERCAFVILPSCSESMPTSIINTVGNGALVPILPKSASIGIDDLTIPINELSKNGVLQAIECSQSKPASDLKIWSEKIGLLVNKNYTIEKYSENIKSNLKEILHENNL